ncbi:CPBP family intramembrane glutamic endopeptidase [Haloarculaceae archaeon H-GB11]|nr:CPBP family intramembrane glutamic endopeptidase [Haloarculaceae archaeon H-GB11]
MDRPRDYVWNLQSHRPRLPVRLVLAVIVLAVFGFVVALAADAFLTASLLTVASALTGGGGPASQPDVIARNVAGVTASTVGTVGGVYLVGRFVDRRHFADFGFRIDRGWYRDLGVGLLLGAGLMTAVFLVELALGWVRVTDTFRVAQTGFAFWPWVLWSAVFFTSVALTEELLLRGYLLTNVAEGLTWFDGLSKTGAIAVATLLTSALFGVGHFGNPNATLVSTLGILLAGVMLALGYVVSGELALPIGLHLTWNFFQGPVFGLPVSGIDFGVSVLAVEQSGPTVLTGGPFGPEAGLLGMAAVLVGSGLIVAYGRWQRSVQEGVELS